MISLHTKILEENNEGKEGRQNKKNVVEWGLKLFYSYCNINKQTTPGIQLVVL